ncbi:hypothetical protein, partial [Vibrio genomosp. F10]|uniref:hypothetical protein n=1 Tax=Vibrio genomosp. F10 TaxID=723171 RepID=UPI0011126F0F
MRLLTILVATVMIVGCQSVGSLTKVPISFTTLQFNSVAEKYYTQHTYAVTEDYSYISVFVDANVQGKIIGR